MSGSLCDSTNASSFFGRGSSYSRQGDYDNAIKDYTRAIEINPSNSTYYNNRGVIYELALDYKSAIRDYSDAIRFDMTEGLRISDADKRKIRSENAIKHLHLDPAKIGRVKVAA